MIAGRRIWIRAQGYMMRHMDVLAARLRRPSLTAHLATGTVGEREALFHLREMGYTVVARRWRTPKLRGEVDLIAWDGEWLCFVEVKTRSSRGMVPAEAAVDDDKQVMLRRMARAYLRGFPEAKRKAVSVRFDVVSVYFHFGEQVRVGSRSSQSAEIELEVQKGAFRWA